LLALHILSIPNRYALLSAVKIGINYELVSDELLPLLRLYSTENTKTELLTLDLLGIDHFELVNSPFLKLPQIWQAWQVIFLTNFGAKKFEM